MTDSPTYKAFISYSHADEKWAKWLHRQLESFRTPHQLKSRDGDALAPDRLNPIFRDRDELEASYDLSESVSAALDQSEHLIVICSPAAVQSHWVDREIQAYKQLGRSKHIHCLIVDGDPQADGAGNDCFPPALRQRYNENGEKVKGTTEPIAADLRPGADGKILARLKIIAGLLDVRLDALVQRERHRRNRRMMAVTVSSIAAALFTTALAIDAIVSRDEAEIARSEAEQRREQAEELLGFMVGDLRKNLQPIGRLDLLESVGQQAMAYFNTVDVTKLTNGELLRQAEVFTQLGEIRFEQLQYQEALAAFTEAYERSAALYQNDDSNPQRLFQRSQAEFWVGYVAYRTGSLDEAQIWMTRYRDSAQSLYTMDPDNRDWKLEVAYGHHNLAVVAADAGNIEHASQEFAEEIQIFDELLSTGPDTELQESRADAFSWLGRITVNQGTLLKAREYYQISRESLNALVQADENNAQLLEGLGWALVQEARILGVTGERSQSRKVAEWARKIFADLVQRDPSNAQWRLSQGQVQLMLGYLDASVGNWVQALATASKEIKHRSGMISDESNDHTLKTTLAEAYRLEALSHKAMGDTVTALASADAGITHMLDVKKSTTLNDTRLGALIGLLVLKGELHGLAEQAALRESALTEATVLLEAKNASASPWLQDPRVRLLLLTGRQSQAQSVGGELAANHYVPLIPWPDLYRPLPPE
jgi:tetratricopeptide (TPR) repeat protein